MTSALKIGIAVLVLQGFATSGSALAQDRIPGLEASSEVQQPIPSAQELRAKLPVEPNKMRSLVFTQDEYNEIIAAKNARGQTRAVEDSELKAEPEEILDLPPPDQRYITLGGIVYDSPKLWTIWLNQKRVSPEAIPEEVIDLIVSKEYIEMKWYDKYTKQIIPLRLRTHQRYHLDARIFLPG